MRRCQRNGQEIDWPIGNREVEMRSFGKLLKDVRLDGSGTGARRDFLGWRTGLLGRKADDTDG